MSVTSTPDCNFDIIESVQFSNGPTSRTTTGQFTMSTTEKLKQFMDDVLEKDEEINRLKEENERLKQENERLKQHKGPDHFLSNRNGDCRIKAIELKKALDDWLGQDHQSRPMRPITAANANVLLPTFSPVTNPHPNVDVNKPSTSANENPKPFRPADEPSTNGTNHHLTHTNFKEPNDNFFGTQQDFRPQSDIDIVNQATDMQHRHFAPYNNNLPTVANGNNNNANRRFVPPNNNFNGMGGMNNNNNRNRSSHITHVNHSNSNSNNNNNNNNNKQNQYTIFISWPGSMTIEELRELFEPSDIEDIRYTNQKQFAHIDLKSESALNKAMALGGTTKNSKQGELRVERGKPRSTNTAENGQRSQHQNKNFNRQNNKSVNGYPPQKHNNNKYGYNNSNHSGQYSTFVAPEENFTMSSNGSNGLNPSLSQQEHTKQSGDTV